MKHLRYTGLLAVFALLGAGCQTTSSASVEARRPASPVQQAPETQPPLPPGQQPGNEDRAKEGANAEVDAKAAANINDTLDIKAGTGAKAEAKTVSTLITGFAYSPVELRVKQGDKVLFINKDAVRHTVTSDDGSSFDSGLLGQDMSFSLDTSKLKPGTYTYHCTPHPMMKASLIIE